MQLSMSHYSPRGGGREAQMIRLGEHASAAKATALCATNPRFHQTYGNELVGSWDPRIPPRAEGLLRPTSHY